MTNEQKKQTEKVKAESKAKIKAEQKAQAAKVKTEQDEHAAKVKAEQEKTKPEAVITEPGFSEMVLNDAPQLSEAAKTSTAEDVADVVTDQASKAQPTADLSSNSYINADEVTRLAESKKAAKTKAIFSFPTRSRCPRCRAIDTVALNTKGRVQYRQCRRAVCRHKYTMFGKKV